MTSSSSPSKSPQLLIYRGATLQRGRGSHRAVKVEPETQRLTEMPANALDHFRKVTIGFGERRIIFADFNQGEFKIGRATNGLHLFLEPNEVTSRWHLTFLMKNGRVLLWDTSRRGTIYDSKFLKGDKVEIPENRFYRLMTIPRAFPKAVPPKSKAPFDLLEFWPWHDGQGNLEIHLRSFFCPQTGRGLPYWVRRQADQSADTPAQRSYYLTAHQSEGRVFDRLFFTNPGKGRKSRAGNDPFIPYELLGAKVVIDNLSI